MYRHDAVRKQSLRQTQEDTKRKLAVKDVEDVPSQFPARLQQLSLEGKSLERLPAQVLNLELLTTLTLSRNKLTVLPTEIGELIENYALPSAILRRNR